MTAVFILIIFLVVMILFFILFLLLGKRQERTLKTIDNKGKVKENKVEKKENNSSNSADKKKNLRKEDVFKFMEFDKILNNMIVQNNGSRFTVAVKCKGINYDLMSEVEQLAVEEGFITFLNTLRYPIQLYVQAQNIDLKSVVKKYRENTTNIYHDYEEINKEYTRLASTFDVDENQLNRLAKERDSITNVYEYAYDMISYVEKMSGNKNLLQRNFYVLISYSTSEIPAVDKFSKEELIEMCFTELTTRAQAIISALSSCSVSGKMLDSNELADLLYSAYNRDDKGLMGVREALDSGIFRLYSTSEDAIYRKTIALNEYLKSEAKIRALETMKQVILNDEIETPAFEAIKEEEEISKRATNMIKAEDFDQDFKNKVNRQILSDFRETKKVLLEEDKKMKQEYIEEANEELKELDELKKIEKPEGIQLFEKAKQLKKEEDEANNINQGNSQSDNQGFDIEIDIDNKENNSNDDSNNNQVNNDIVTDIYSGDEDDSVL